MTQKSVFWINTTKTLLIDFLYKITAHLTPFSRLSSNWSSQVWYHFENWDHTSLTLKWSRGVPMDPKISFRALARKRKVIGRSPSLTSSNFTLRFFWWQKNLH